MKKALIVLSILSVIGLVNLWTDDSFVFLSKEETEPRPLIFGIQPYLPADQLIKKFTPLVSSLEKQLHRKIEIRVSKDYDAHISNVGNDRYDLAYLGPIPYVKMTDLHGGKPLLATIAVNKLPWFFGVVVVKADSPYQTGKDLNQPNLTFAFTQRLATMGHYVPKGLMVRAGIDRKILNNNHEHFLHHQDVVSAVLSGTHAAGGIRDDVFKVYQNKGLRLIAKSDPVATHVIVASSRMKPELRERITTRLLNMHNVQNGPQVLKNIRSDLTAFLHADDLNFNYLRDLMAAYSDTPHSH